MTDYVYSWIIAVLPGLIYPTLAIAYFLQHRGRKTQMEELLALSDVKQAYLKAFGNPRQTAGRAEGDEAHNGLQSPLNLDRKSWVLPISISVLMALAGTVACMIVAGRRFGLPELIETWIRANVTPLAMAGFAGGYIWGLYDILERFGILNWTAESTHWVYFRLVLGPILGGYLATLANPQIGRFVAFAVAAFPATAIRDWMQALARSKLGLPDSTESNVKPNWELVQGLTPDIVDRLKRAGVSSTAHLANEDPMRLLRVTNIGWRSILDMLDQACLAVYVGQSIERLRPMGIRGAVEMAAVYHRSKSDDEDRRKRAEATMNKIGDFLGLEEAKNLARNLGNDPVVALINWLWFGNTLSERPTETQEAAAGSRR
jgi:hypothetical protein